MAHLQAIAGDPTPSADPVAELDLSAPLESIPSVGESLGSTDPRVRRTRQLLQQAIADLLHTRDFDKISVQDITEAAGVNRATFYAHYPDKFALLECMVASRFHALLDQRGVVFDGTCSSAITGIILGVCDFLAQSLAQSLTQPTPTDCPSPTHVPPHMETAIVAVVRGMLLEGIRNHPPATPITAPASPELLASTAAWAIYGAAREWVKTPNRPPSEEVAVVIQRLVAPLLHPESAA